MWRAFVDGLGDNDENVALCKKKKHSNQEYKNHNLCESKMTYLWAKMAKQPYPLESDYPDFKLRKC